MAANCKKCDPHEICEECPEWIFTLADLIMCMMGLFVLLWVLKPSGKPASQALSSDEAIATLADIREAFGYEAQAGSSDPIDIEVMTRRIRRNKLHGNGDAGRTTNDNRGQDGTDQETTSIRQGKQSAVGGRLQFEQSSVQLTPEVQQALLQIIRQIKGHRNIVMVKGHASLDDLADDATPEQKMALSVTRAQAVADFLTGNGVQPDILRVQGCSTFEPVVQREYRPDTQANNRRVEVEVSAMLVSERQDAKTETPAVPDKQDSHAQPQHRH